MKGLRTPVAIVVNNQNVIGVWTMRVLVGAALVLSRIKRVYALVLSRTERVHVLVASVRVYCCSTVSQE